MSNKKENKEPEQETAVSEPIPFFTGHLDTSEEGVASISDQLSRTVAYNEERSEAEPAIIEGGLPEGAVTEDNALGLSKDNEVPLDEDTVAGHPLDDGKKDPADKIEKPAATDVTVDDAV